MHFNVPFPAGHCAVPLPHCGIDPVVQLLQDGFPPVELVDDPLELELVDELPELELEDDEVDVPQKSASGSIEVTLSQTDVHCPKKNLHFAVPFPAEHCAVPLPHCGAEPVVQLLQNGDPPVEDVVLDDPPELEDELELDDEVLDVELVEEKHPASFA